MRGSGLWVGTWFTVAKRTRNRRSLVGCKVKALSDYGPNAMSSHSAHLIRSRDEKEKISFENA